MFTDVETFQEAHMASGLPPVLSGRQGSGAFRADLVSSDLGPLRLIGLFTPAGECYRDARRVRAEDEELWQIELITRGWARVEQGRGTADLGPSDLILVDPARPVRFASTACQHVTVLVPRRDLRLRSDDADRLVGVRIRGDGGPGALVSALAGSVVHSVTGLGADAAARSAAALTELISVALESQLGDTRLTPDQALRDRIIGYIEARLTDPDLAPARIAAAHHISVRRLHRLFEDQPLTVAALIRRRRLERSRADLARGDRTVSAVATRWGFVDPAHFSRLFRATYGYNAASLTAARRARKVKDHPDRPGQDVSTPITER